jgi:arylsulfatase
VGDKDYQVPVAFTGKIDKITLTIDRPKLTQVDEKRLMQASRENKVNA